MSALSVITGPLISTELPVCSETGNSPVLDHKMHHDAGKSNDDLCVINHSKMSALSVITGPLISTELPVLGNLLLFRLLKLSTLFKKFLAPLILSLAALRNLGLNVTEEIPLSIIKLVL
jgi:hypothetical protein